MNLSDQRVKSVTSHRPQLIHSDSKQSVTASDDYYSLDSDQSHEEPPHRYKTPPQSREVLQSEGTIPTIRPAKHQPQSTYPPRRPLEVHFDNKTKIQRKPVPSEGIVAQRAADSELSPPTPGVDDTPYIQFAIEQLTRDEELLGPRNHGVGSLDSHAVGRPVQDLPMGINDGDIESTRDERHSSDTIIRRPTILSGDNIFIPIDPTDGYRHPELNFIPGPLRLLSLGLLLFSCLLVIAALIFCNVRSIKHNGLWRYDGVSTSRYFVFQFLPQILASVIVIWLLVIQTALHRIFPFITLASGRSPWNSDVLHNASLIPTTFLIPNLIFFKHAESLLGVCSVIFWLALFTVPLQACLFQTRYYTIDGQSVWNWTAVQPIGWTLLALYILLVAALTLLFLRLWRQPTGLKWDAASLADILVLAQHSNVLSDFEGSEDQTYPNKVPISKQYRLGYWRTSNQPNDAFHGIGEAHAPVDRYFLTHGLRKSGGLDERNRDRKSTDNQSQRAFSTDSFEPGFQTRAERYGYVPWSLRDSCVVAWIVTAIVLMIAFLILSFVNHPLTRGFLPLLPAPTTSKGFSPADFLYSFLPAFVGMLLFLLFQPIDLAFRALQPYANLADVRGATAEQSLLLDYTACLPGAVTVKAALAGHLKVAWLSFMATTSITLPILGGGVFTAQFFPASQDVRIAASMPAYDALVFFVVLYALSFLLVWPGHKRHLPHDFRTLGQMISFVYCSPLLQDDMFREPQSRIDLVTRLLAGSKAQRYEKARYAFGSYKGWDGNRRLGIDQINRDGEKSFGKETV